MESSGTVRLILTAQSNRTIEKSAQLVKKMESKNSIWVWRKGKKIDKSINDANTAIGDVFNLFNVSISLS